MKYAKVRVKETGEPYFLKSMSYAQLERSTELDPYAVVTGYPSLDHDNGASTFNGDQLEIVYFGDTELGKPLVDLVEEAGGLDDEGKFNSNQLEVKTSDADLKDAPPEYYLDNEHYFRDTEAVSSEVGVRRYSKECFVVFLDGDTKDTPSSSISKAYLADGEEELVNTDDLSGDPSQVGAWWVEQLVSGSTKDLKEVRLLPYDEALEKQSLKDAPDFTDAMAMAVRVAQEDAQKFAKGRREMKEGGESILNVSAGRRLGAEKIQALNEGVDPSVIFDEPTDTIAVNFDDHYKQAKSEKVPEPIDVIEALEVRLVNAGVDVNEACNICRGLKYVLRGSFKEGEDVAKELRKFYNYTHRARTGEWLGGK